MLFGDYNPAGRLPVTFYKNTEQLPDFEDYALKGRTYRYMQEKPLFPFGYGLSYTTFRYGKAKLSQSTLTNASDKIQLSIPVRNTGLRDGEEVVQIYLQRPADKEGPTKTLRAFKRVRIAKETTQVVEFELPYTAFEWFDTASNTMHTQSGIYTVLYGSSSQANDLQSISVSIK